MGVQETADSGFDIGGAVDAVASAMVEKETPEVVETTEEVTETVEQPEKAAANAPQAPTAPRQPPKSWSKDKHELWSKLPPDAQDYYEQREKQMLDGLEQYKGDAGYAKQLKEILSPYKATLQSQGVTETDAVKFLMNAHYRLTNGTIEERKSAYESLGAQLGLIAQQAAAEQGPVDPMLKQLRAELDQVKSSLTARQQADLQTAQAKAASEVEAFASQESNLYFNEVAQDMVPYINQGLALKDAYDRAVWANPVTRAKEQARIQTESANAAAAKAKQETAEARRASSTNVRDAESRKAPTEPKGKMFDDMGDMLKSIKARTN